MTKHVVHEPLSVIVGESHVRHEVVLPWPVSTGRYEFFHCNVKLLRVVRQTLGRIDRFLLSLGTTFGCSSVFRRLAFVFSLVTLVLAFLTFSIFSFANEFDGWSVR